jgi:uncharacterized protein
LFLDGKKIRKWNRVIHRDLGYLAVGLTLIYAISGFVVNHVQDWNPNYEITHVNSNVGKIDLAKSETDIIVKDILQKLSLPPTYKTTFRPEPEILRIFVKENTIDVNIKTGEAIQEIVKTRPLIYEMNFLHLNHPKKAWTYVADLYAISLAALAITGLFVLKGKQGITGRGAWFTAAGIVLPIVFLWLYL